MSDFSADAVAYKDPNVGQVFSLQGCPVAAKFYWDRSRISYIQGCFGSGKSVAAIQKLMMLAASQEPNADGIRKSRAAVVRNTFSQLMDTTVRTWLDWFPPPVWGTYLKSSNEYNMRWALEDGTIVELEVWFRGLDRPDQVSNLLSAEYSFCFFNEARGIAIEIFEAMDGRIGRYPPKKDGAECTNPCIVMDSNPPDEDHWIYKLFEEERPANAKAFYQPSGLSPEAENIKNLPDNYYENLAQGKDDYFVNVYVHGKYGYLREGKPVYPAYTDNIHCNPEIEMITGRPLYIGLDFGLTPSCVIAQQDVSGRLLVLDEVTSERAGIKQFLEVVLPYISTEYAGLNVAGWYCDPRGADSGQADMTSPYDVMYDVGIVPEDGLQDPVIRVESVTNLLNRMVDGSPAITISHRCKMLRKGFSGAYHYRRLKVSKERYVDKPDKNEFSHIHDALQYLCTRLYGAGVSTKKAVMPKVVGMGRRR